MTPGEANDDSEPAVVLQGTVGSLRTPILQRKSVRTAVVAFLTLTSLAATLLIAYELAVARVPEQRAALERLVRAQTGLDVRFDELAFRWGWYGPEAVFTRVELGEPGRSNVLLRAPELVVGFDAWATMRTGQLSAGRITLVAPDINLERIAGSGRPQAEDTVPTRASVNTGSLHILERWRGGRIDLQGGTLRMPGVDGATSSIVVQIRRASLRHSDDEWNGFGLVFLPERLGRAARIVVQVQGDLAHTDRLNGAFRFEGMRLVFAGWREVLASVPQLARNLPAAGGGDVNLHVTLKDGRIDKADGQVRATDVSFGTPPWIQTSSPAYAASGDSLKLDYMAGEWRFVRRAEGGQLQVERLALSRADKDEPLPPLSVEFGAGRMHGSVARAPLPSVMAIAQWLAPTLLPAGVVLKGSAQDIHFDWNGARPEGERLAASARVSNASVAAGSGGFVLSGLSTKLAGTENLLAVDLDAPAARLDLQASPEHPLNALKIVSALEVIRTTQGWRLTTPRLTVDHASGHLVLDGSLSGGAMGGAPMLDARGTVTHADLAKLQQLLAGVIARSFAPSATRLYAGQIDDAKFELKGPLDTLFTAPCAGAACAALSSAGLFKGSLALHDARIAADGPWPDAKLANAKLEWNGPRIRASVDEGTAGAFELESVQAQWDVSGARVSRVTGRARAHLEEALAWMRAHPELQEHAPHLQDLVARGEALVDFDVFVPANVPLAPRAMPPRTRARLAAVLEGVQFQLAPGLPPVEAVRGSLAFDSGRLQRSTLSATWLGGPLTLSVSERRDRRSSAMAVQAQGFIDAQKLVALTQIQNLPQVSGQTPWSGEFLYTSPSELQPARWQGRVDSSLAGVASELPAPFAKLADAALPLHVEILGSGEESEVNASLADRVRTAFALKVHGGTNWQIERGAIQLGGGAALLPADDVIAVQGHVKHFDLPEYLVAWQHLRSSAETSVVIDIAADELAVGNRLHLNANVHSSQTSSGTEVRVESPSLGVLTGTLAATAQDVVFKDLHLAKDGLVGVGSIRCVAALTTCHGKFELKTDDTAATLADLGFRPELSATKGSLSGEVTWQPRAERPWLETATGQLSMLFEDGVTHNSANSSARSFPLLTVPALLSGIARPPAAEAMPAGELSFKRLEADFQLRDGQAFTSNLHFDGDAEILVRGRAGLLARDYDHEAWVLRGEDRIPASLRRLAATPRVAAAWMTLRDLIRGDAPDRSRVVLHLRGSWNEPVVTVD